MQTLFYESCWDSFHCWIALSCARTPATIASVKHLVLAVEQEIFHITHNNTDGAIPTIHVTYFQRLENRNKLL